MAPSKKHFVAVSKAIVEVTDDSNPNSLKKDALVSKLAGIFADSNPHFNSAKFRDACYKDTSE